MPLQINNIAFRLFLDHQFVRNLIWECRFPDPLECCILEHHLHSVAGGDRFGNCRRLRLPYRSPVISRCWTNSAGKRFRIRTCSASWGSVMLPEGNCARAVLHLRTPASSTRDIAVLTHRREEVGADPMAKGIGFGRLEIAIRKFSAPVDGAENPLFSF